MSVLSARSLLANAVKKAKASGETAERSSAVRTARQELASAKIAAYVKRIVEEAPPFTDDQRAKLTQLLAGVVDPARGPTTHPAVGARRCVINPRKRGAL